LSNLIITNAEDLKYTGFACWISETDGVPTQLDIDYNATQKTLKLGLPAAISFLEMRDIHFGQKNVDFNICEEEDAHYYRIGDDKETPDLSGN
jgi:hypothetical protein